MPTADTPKVTYFDPDFRKYQTWLTYTISAPNPSGYVKAQWTLKGEWIGTGGVQTGSTSWIDGSTTSSGVCTFNKSDIVGFKALVMLGNYALGGGSFRRIWACYRVQAQTQDAVHITQRIHNYCEREEMHLATGNVWKIIGTSGTAAYNPEVKRIPS